MATERLVVREMAWRDLCPWLILFRTFGLAIALPVLFLATLGALLTPIGWLASETVFLGPQAMEDVEFQQTVAAHRSWIEPRPAPDEGLLPASVREIVFTQPGIVEPVFHRFVQPLARLVGAQLTPQQAAYYLLGMLWMLLVWGFFGGAITRIAVVKLGREEQIGLGEAVRHAVRKWAAYIGSPLFPLVGVVLIALPIVGLGMLMRFDWGVVVAGVLWFIVLLGGLSIAVLLLGLLFGWPLMWGVISSEEHGDAFEAFSRSYSYTFQRPLHYLFYAVVASIFGALAWLLVYHFSEAVIMFCRRSALLGAGTQRWEVLSQWIAAPGAGPAPASFGAWLIGMFETLVRVVAAAFGYSFFWCLAAAVYLLLRRDVDQTEFDEVFVENENRRYELPQLKAADQP